jgi:hypothetical protein
VSDSGLNELDSFDLKEQVPNINKLTAKKVNYYNYQLGNKVKIKLLNLI